MNYESQKKWKFYVIEARLHILLEVRKAVKQLGPRGHSKTWRSPEAKDSAGGTSVVGADFGQKIYFSACFHASEPISLFKKAFFIFCWKIWKTDVFV